MQEEKLSAAVGRKIAALRKERGLTQKQLADKIYTSDKNISKWETGRALPDLEPLAEPPQGVESTLNLKQ